MENRSSSLWGRSILEVPNPFGPAGSKAHTRTYPWDAEKLVKTGYRETCENLKPGDLANLQLSMPREHMDRNSTGSPKGLGAAEIG